MTAIQGGSVMKIMILSDSHGDAETMYHVVENEKPDMIIYLGDGIADAEQLGERYPSIKMIKVLGGLDSDKPDEEWIKIAEICGKRFVIAHGHTFIAYTYDEKADKYRQTDADLARSRRNMLEIIRDNNADILLHGHTHEPYINRTQIAPGRICWIMNPGRIGRGDGGILKPTYGVLKIYESGTFEWRIKEHNE